jgi:hypothetical protein
MTEPLGCPIGPRHDKVRIPGTFFWGFGGRRGPESGCWDLLVGVSDGYEAMQLLTHDFHFIRSQIRTQWSLHFIIIIFLFFIFHATQSVRTKHLSSLTLPFHPSPPILHSLPSCCTQRIVISITNSGSVEHLPRMFIGSMLLPISTPPAKGSRSKPYVHRTHGGPSRFSRSFRLIQVPTVSSPIKS